MGTKTGWPSSVLILTLLPVAWGQPAKPSPVLEAMRQELTRSMTELRKQPSPPYFLSYSLNETEAVNATGSFGTLVSSFENRSRQLAIDLRVGSYERDNTREVRGTAPVFMDFYSPLAAPIENDLDALRAQLWYHTDQRYKRAVEQWITIQTNAKVKADVTDKTGDFSPAKAEVFTEAVQPPLKVSKAEWEAKVRKYSSGFKRYGNIYSATVNLEAKRQTQWLTSSEGSAIQSSRTGYTLMIRAFAKADDGMVLPRIRTFYSTTLQGLPSDETVDAAVAQMARELMALKLAPVMDPYTGPALLSGRAAGVWFHEIFGHRIEGARAKREDDAQTFKHKVGEPVLPAWMSVYSDPTLTRAGDSELMGTYEFDDEGVRARRVPVVENGILRNFLMSRTPIDGFPASNGHGRSMPGYRAAARQSNLIVEARQAVPFAKLKERLLEHIKSGSHPYGLLIDDIQGGFTFVGRGAPNAFNVVPSLVYRIYPDGRQELVRGVDLIGTPLASFSKIVAAGDQAVVFNGICGAESGPVPVSAASPALLISQIEVQKKPKSQERSPILAPPFDDSK